MTFSNMLSFGLLPLVYIALCVLLPIYAGIHAWRKGRQGLAALAYLSVSVPFVGFPVGAIAFIVCKLWQPKLDVHPKLLNFSGCGTGFAGATDRADDGSFLTTEWFKVFLIPLVPIQSYRVSYGGRSSSFGGVVISQTKQYYIYAKEKLKLSHVVRTYALLAAFYLVLVGLLGTFHTTSSLAALSTSQSVALGAVIVAFLALGFKFWRAK